jgi:ligand-binding SRPBCC domain-containing protein
MVSGPFRLLEHDHFFADRPPGRTVMKDVLAYASPWGPIGRIADILFLQRYMRRLLQERNAGLKRLAEVFSSRNP